jgi:hypothetical protein
VVLAVFFVLIVAGLPIIARYGWPVALTYVVVLDVALVVVCRLKGEAPRWRWNK